MAKIPEWVTDNLPESIENWCAREFNAKYADRVAQDLIDHMTGNRPGNQWVREACDMIQKYYDQAKATRETG